MIQYKGMNITDAKKGKKDMSMEFTVESPGIEQPKQDPKAEAKPHSAWRYVAKGMASVAICALGAYCLWLTDGKTGIGWAVLGLIIIW